MFSQIVLFLILLISLNHLRLVIQGKGISPFLKCAVALIILYTINGIITYVGGGNIVGVTKQSIVMRFLRSFYISVLPIFSFYYYAKKGDLTLDSLKKWAYVFLILAIALYYRVQRETLDMLWQSNIEEVTNNGGYIVVALIPCVLLFKKQWMQYAWLGVCVVFMFFSMKRGAVLSGLLGIMAYIFHSRGNMKMSNRIIFMIGALVVGYGLFIFLQSRLSGDYYFQQRVELTLEGGSSGRDLLSESCMAYFRNRASTIQKIFGTGAYASLFIAGNYAHNDWLELLIDQGIVGVFVFLLFWINFYRETRKSYLCKTSRMALMMVFLICFSRTFYSMSINDISIFLSSIMGLAMCDGFKVVDNSTRKIVYNG